MAVYDGFFDAVQNETTGEYDRAYNSGDFTEYFWQMIGDGVCVHGNPDSMKVRMENGAAVVGPGYLFIQGYWLKNTADYTVSVPATGTYAVLAHLNLGKRMIEIIPQSMAQAYPDSLVLALVNAETNTAEDTRYNTDICGVIDSAGNLSEKVTYAVNYIDKEIDGKLASIEAAIDAKSRELDAKIAEVQRVADAIIPPPVGSVKFSASQDVGPEWLRCNGQFVNEKQYPELVAALGKLTPSGDHLKQLQSSGIGANITNGVLYAGRLWVYSYSDKKLYGIDTSGASAPKAVTVTATDSRFPNFLAPTTARPLCLSICPHHAWTGNPSAKLFLTQILSDGGSAAENKSGWEKYFLIFSTEFTGNETSVTVSMPFSSIASPQDEDYTAKTYYMYTRFNASAYVPYVISRLESGTEYYYCAAGEYWSTYGRSYIGCLSWKSGDSECGQKKFAGPFSGVTGQQGSRVAFSKKAKNELVSISLDASNTLYGFNISSYPNGIFEALNLPYPSGTKPVPRQTQLPLTIAGGSQLLYSFDKLNYPWVSYEKSAFGNAVPQVSLPNISRVFVDAAAYLWGKDIFMVFVGTGLLFSRDLAEFGYLHTTDLMGTITQSGYLDYSEDEGTLYLLGQDSANQVKAGKIVLNTLYDYASDGAWLPLLASDGVPAYIKAVGNGNGGGNNIPENTIRVKVLDMQNNTSQDLDGALSVLFNGSILATGEYDRAFGTNTGNFTVGIRASLNPAASVRLYGNGMILLSANGFSSPFPATETVSLPVADYVGRELLLQIRVSY